MYSIDTEAKTATLIANEDDEYKGDIFIPEKVKAKNGATCTVVALGEKCFENCGIKSVIIPSTVKSIVDECFKSCIHHPRRQSKLPFSLLYLSNTKVLLCSQCSFEHKQTLHTVRMLLKILLFSLFFSFYLFHIAFYF